MHSQEKKNWHKIAEGVSELFSSENSLLELTIKGKQVCIVMHQGKLFACAAKCPHAGGKLADGYIDLQGNIVCPLHRYKFSLQSGRNITGEGYYLKTWPIELTENGVYISIENKTLF